MTDSGLTSWTSSLIFLPPNKDCHLLPRNRHVVLSLEKSPKSVEDQLKEPMPVEQKVEIAKDLIFFAGMMYTFKVIVDTCSTVVINAAWKGAK